MYAVAAMVFFPHLLISFIGSKDYIIQWKLEQNTLSWILILFYSAGSFFANSYIGYTVKIIWPLKNMK